MNIRKSSFSKHLKLEAKFRISVLVMMAIFALSLNLNAQNQPPAFVREAVRSVENMLDSKDDSAITSFIEGSMKKREDIDMESLLKKISSIRGEMRGLRDDISVEAADNGVILIMSDGEIEKHLKIELDFEGEKIIDLQLVENKTVETLTITTDNLSETFDQLEKEGIAGVVYVKIDNKVILQRGFGMANKELGIANNLNTIFGTGSRPIDYTVAAIYLLDQQGKLKLDDKINQHFEGVPEDKSAMTIKHLLTGQSGLPDFFHTSEDWDADLAWIDRETAVERLLSQKLLFEPGKGQRHSHGAFGLLAALIEMVADKSYYEFLNENFFEPAGMERTGEYGEIKNLTVADFAVGGGPQFIGLPNIPPNWGPTSWLIKGSGGMYSTLSDLLKFYDYLRSGKVLDEEHSRVFRQASVQLDGSDRGFELFSAHLPPNKEVYLFLNEIGSRENSRKLFRALEGFLENN